MAIDTYQMAHSGAEIDAAVDAVPAATAAAAAAQSTANTAKSNAATAQSTANGAVSDAATNTAAITALGASTAKAQYITSGSMNDITDSGMYFLAAGVKDKPVTAAGAFFYAASGGNGAGIYVPRAASNGSIYNVYRSGGGAFSYKQII